MLLVQCGQCGATGFADDHGSPDAAVTCSCCADHESPEHHAAEVARTGDASCRPVSITVMPGAVTAGPAA